MSENSSLDFLTTCEGPLVIDTGIFIEYLQKTEKGKLISEKIVNNPEISELLVHDLLITEIYYIFCRTLSSEKSNKIIDDLLEIVSVVDSSEIRLIAGEIKCERAIALSDCYSLASASAFNIPVIFLQEKELKKEIDKKPFDIDLYLLD